MRKLERGVKIVCFHHSVENIWVNKGLKLYFEYKEIFVNFYKAALHKVMLVGAREKVHAENFFLKK